MKIRTPRDVRKWHWLKVLQFRARAQRHEGYAAEAIVPSAAANARRQARAYHRRANEHLSAVQALNDVPELQGSTAEQDCARDPA